jgi:bacterial/archaeal transporter family protein
MYYLWLWLTLISGILLGFYDISKKKALEKDTLFKVLSLYALFCFLIVFFEIQNALQISEYGLLLVFIKSIVIFISWIMGFLAIKNLPISVITPFATLSPLFSILFGVLLLHERLHLNQIFGIGIMLTSYYFIAKTGAAEVNGLFRNKYLYLMAASMFLSATSALIDKVALKTVNTGQLQFWFSLFLSIFYIASYFISRRVHGKENLDSNVKKVKFEEMGFKKILKHIPYFIILMSILLVASDRIYFYAVKMPESLISVVMPLRKISILVSAIIGGFIFKEKNLKAKFGNILLLVLGIALIFIGKKEMTLLINNICRLF